MRGGGNPPSSSSIYHAKPLDSFTTIKISGSSMQTMQIENAVVILAMLVRASPTNFFNCFLITFVFSCIILSGIAFFFLSYLEAKPLTVMRR